MPVKYELLGELAHGGMATVFLGRAGDGRTSALVAIKSMKPELAGDRTYAQMFVDEATLTRQIKHPNVVATLDLANEAGRLLLVMEYVDGVTVSRLLELGPIPPRIAVAIAGDVLRGLHAAHDLAVHRDVSPANVIAGVDGMARILDFGVAKASSAVHVTVRGEIKGKLAYMPPEQAKGELVDRRADIWSVGVVLWEMLVGRRLFDGRTEQELIKQVFAARVAPPSMVADEELPAKLDQVVLRALKPNRDDRWATAAQMADALGAAATPAEVGAWLQTVAAADLRARAALIHQLEATPLTGEAETLQTLLTSRSSKPSSRELRRKRRRMKGLLTIATAIVVVLLLMAAALVIGQKARQSHSSG